MGRLHKNLFIKSGMWLSYADFLERNGQRMTKNYMNAKTKHIANLLMYAIVDSIPLWMFSYFGFAMLYVVDKTKVLGMFWVIILYSSHIIWHYMRLRKNTRNQYDEIMKQAKMPTDRWGK